jgi:hypothetical protein
MSNYPLGAENDSNAPFNKEESLQGETIGLFEYLENLEMPYEVRIHLKNFIKGFELSKVGLNHVSENLRIESRDEYKMILNIQRLLQEPQIFIENE